jgi:hypothetical protein
MTSDGVRMYFVCRALVCLGLLNDKEEKDKGKPESENCCCYSMQKSELLREHREAAMVAARGGGGGGVRAEEAEHGIGGPL